MKIQLDSLRTALADKMGSVLTPELAASIIFQASNKQLAAQLAQSQNQKAAPDHGKR